MHISVLTLFPTLFTTALDISIMKRAQQKGTVSFSIINIRDFAQDAYKSVDDHPYGGGHGMILRVDVIAAAIEFARTNHPAKHTKIILPDPQGTPYKQQIAQRLTKTEHLILICGHYEGIDERVRSLVDEEVSLGDYVLTGGELPALVVIDSVVRLLPGVLAHENATQDESFSQTNPLLEYPQYTRPPVYEGQAVPEVLLSGNHREIALWRKNQSITRTKKRRPDILKSIKG